MVMHKGRGAHPPPVAFPPKTFFKQQDHRSCRRGGAPSFQAGATAWRFGPPSSATASPASLGQVPSPLREDGGRCSHCLWGPLRSPLSGPSRTVISLPLKSGPYGTLACLKPFLRRRRSSRLWQLEARASGLSTQQGKTPTANNSVFNCTALCL